MTKSRYQFTVADGSPVWTKGRANYEDFWAHVHDHLRFHRGSGFQINDRKVERLDAVHDDLRELLDNHDAGTSFTVASLRDRFDIRAKRIEIDDTKGDIIVANARDFTGTPYVFGVTDCSWLSEASYKPEIGDDWVHNAHAQHLMFGSLAGYVDISRQQVRVGDLLFIDNDQHVAVYAGRLEAFGNIECVIDTEPHDTVAPAGWPTPNLQTGVHPRPMIGNYYCSWPKVNGIGRVVAINGAP